MVKTILAHEDWRTAMRTTHTVRDRRGNEVPETPLRLLIKFFPDLAEQVFDQCVKQVVDGKKKKKDGDRPHSPLSSTTKHRTVVMDYEFIEDTFHYVVSEDPNDSESKYGKFVRSFMRILID